MLWDVSRVTGEKGSTAPLKTTVCSASARWLSWSQPGGSPLLAAACRDKKAYIIDPRSPEKSSKNSRRRSSEASWVCHQGSKPWKVCFANEKNIISIGFGLHGEREVALWDLVVGVDRFFMNC